VTAEKPVGLAEKSSKNVTPSFIGMPKTDHDPFSDRLLDSQKEPIESIENRRARTHRSSLKAEATNKNGTKKFANTEYATKTFINSE
jgi:hypothetical protein